MTTSSSSGESLPESSAIAPILRGRRCARRPETEGTRVQASGGALLLRGRRAHDHPAVRSDIRRTAGASPSRVEASQYVRRHAGRSGTRERRLVEEIACVSRQVSAEWVLSPSETIGIAQSSTSADHPPSRLALVL